MTAPTSTIATAIADTTRRRALVVLLTALEPAAIEESLLPTLAVAGVSGTLRHRLLDSAGHESIRGKTGTTDAASAVAGFSGSAGSSLRLTPQSRMTGAAI